MQIMNYYIVNKKLTDDGIKIIVNNHNQQIDRIMDIKIYNMWEWEKQQKGDTEIKTQLPEHCVCIKREVTITINPDDCTPTFIIIEFTIVNKDETTETLHTAFLNEFSLFKAKGIYLEGLAKDNCGNGCGSFCNNCAEYKDLLGLMTFMLRISLLKDAYYYNNEDLAIHYYKDLQRYVSMDKIPFTCKSDSANDYATPDKLHDLYRYLNHELKHNVSPCAKKVFTSLILSDLYDLFFAMSKGAKHDWILEDHIWNMDDEFWYDNKIWKD